VVDDDELEVIVERSAGLDVHKDIVAVTVRVPGPGGVIEKHQAEFATFTDDLCGLRDWLVALGVTRVGMEATGVYWKPVFYVLEEDFECWLLNARHMHNVPGRKTDMADADWICRLVRFGLVPLVLLRWRIKAKALGVEAGRLRLFVIAAATLMTASVVAIA